MGKSLNDFFSQKVLFRSRDHLCLAQQAQELPAQLAHCYL
jgi:hypothetical protein